MVFARAGARANVPLPHVYVFIIRHSVLQTCHGPLTCRITRLFGFYLCIFVGGAGFGGRKK